MKKVLILGAGMVSAPVIRYLLDKKFSITVASPMKDRADEIIKGHPLGSSVLWSMDDQLTLASLITGNDIVVSLLPYRFHTDVAMLCLKNRKSLVTTSYTQSGIKALDREVRNEGLIFLNEIGLDPGIDHMSAMKIIDGIHRSAGKVVKFCSLCGALPAPEAADNPMRYKFSWSPGGVLLAGRNNALYLRNGEKIYLETENLFRNPRHFYFHGLGELEIYPNRDSLSYVEVYGIREVTTMFRGTLRYPGWCETLDLFKKLDLMDDTGRDPDNYTFAEFLADLAGIPLNNLKRNLADKFNLKEDSTALQSLEFLGFFSNEKIPAGLTSRFGVLSHLMTEKMTLGPKERDMVVMQHIFLAEYPGGKKEVIRSSMLDFGSADSDTAVARTVGLPAAIAVKLILEGKIEHSGVLRPVMPQIYEPVLKELRIFGIEMKEESGLPEKEFPEI